MTKRTILIAPLNWGLGHATRCIPIINGLLFNNFKVLLASDGAALALLRQEFPTLDFLELSSYNISYPKNGRNFKTHLIFQLPQISRAISAEQKLIQKTVSERPIHGIISDNRLGVRHTSIPSVYITHQLNVLTGNTTYFSSKVHQKYIRKFNECWVPDVANSNISLTGKMGHISDEFLTLKYAGVLSRMKKNPQKETIDVLLLISGIEPQRTLLENKLKEVFKDVEKNILMVCGKVERQQKWSNFHNIKTVNYMSGAQLETTLNSSKLVIARSGYSTIMDLAVLKKKALFIPTPGQYEQEYLANRLEKLKIAPWERQKTFSAQALQQVEKYKGFVDFTDSTIDFRSLFSLFSV